jgi:hypothetical protein
MTISELIALLESLETKTAGNAPVVLDLGGQLRLVRGACVEMLAKIQPALYVRAASHRFVETVVVINAARPRGSPGWSADENKREA